MSRQIRSWILTALVLVLPIVAAAVPVMFHYHAPDATTVNIRGSWNNWTDGVDVMTGPDGSGDWHHTVDLAPGAWEYKFFVNGADWITDPENPVAIPGFGNSGLQVASPMIHYVKPMPGTIFPPASAITIQAQFTWDDATSLDTSAIELLVDGDIVTSGAAGYTAATRAFSWTLPGPLADGPHAFEIRVRTTDLATASATDSFVYHATPREAYYDQFDQGIVEGNPGDLNVGFWAGGVFRANYRPLESIPPTNGALRLAAGALNAGGCVSRALGTILPANEYELYARVRMTDFQDTAGERNAEVATRRDGGGGYLLTIDGGNDRIRLRRNGGGYTDIVPPVSHAIHPGDVYYLYERVEGTGPVTLTARVATDTSFSGAALLFEVTTVEPAWVQNGGRVALQSWSDQGDHAYDFDYFSIGEPGYPHPPAAWLRSGYTGSPPPPERYQVGDLDSYEVFPDRVVLHSGPSSVIVTPLLGRTLHVDFVTSGSLAAEPSFAVTRTAWPGSPFTVTDGDPVAISGSRWRVNVSRSPMRLSFCSPDGTPILREAPDAPLAAYGTLRKTGFVLEPDDAIYGLGETSVYTDVGLNRRGSLLDIHNYHQPPSYLIFPTWVSSRNYGVFIDNPSVASLSFGNANPSRIDYSSLEGELGYYVFLGDSMYDIVDQFTQVTGRPLLQPRWTLGNIQSKYGYQSFAEIQSIIDTFNSSQIPLDGIVIDGYWFGIPTMGNLDFTNDANWPNPAQSMANLHSQGYRLIPITEPQISGLSFNAGEVTSQGLVGTMADGVTPYPVSTLTWITNQAPVYLLDFTKQAARAWWKQKHQKLIQDYGFDGFWQDLNEPEGQPDDMRYERGSANKVRNAISIEMNRSLAEAVEEYRPGARPFIMSRSGYAGMQKYGASVWSGDTSCSFEQLSRQPALAQSMGLAGVPYWNSDIGGFNGTPSPELYLRWCQFGFLNPLYRPHGAQSNREPWRFGATVEGQVRELLRLRYRLLPYYYTVSRQAYDTGAPIMRPLVMDWPADPAVSNLGGQYLYGPLLMAAPVTAQGATTWDVYLPEGEWADWFTGGHVAGPTTRHVDVSNGSFPLFVRCPGILPLGPVMNRSDAAPLDPVTLRVFFEDATEHAEGRLYEDDGLSNAYQAGACAWTDFHATRHPGDILTVTISAASGAFQGQLPARGYIVEIPVGAPPSAVWIDSLPLARLADSTGEPATGGWSYDSAAGLIRARADGLPTADSHTFSVNALTVLEGWYLH